VTTWAVVPVRSFETAKSRLSGILDAQARESLARNMFDHVLRVLSATPGVAGIAVVTDSDRVAAVARAGGAVSVFDPPSAGALSDCVDCGLRDIAERGATTGLVLMSDLPALTVDSVEGLLRELDRFDVVVVRDTSGQHTNALGLRLGTPFRTSFGRPDSFEHHCASAKHARLSLSTPDSEAVAFDVDTPGDYERSQQPR
jgi:2-phospho-L-lactate guanylyltransferase